MYCITVNRKSLFTIGILFIAALIFAVNGIDAIPTVSEKDSIPIYSVKTDDKKIAITFDSAWGDEDLTEILDSLKKYDCKATFFVVGDFIEKYPDRIKQMYEAGNEIANHSDTHPHTNSLTREEMIKQMDDCDKKIKDITGQKEVLFRAPYGEYNNLLVQTCKDTGRFCIQWDVDVSVAVGKSLHDFSLKNQEQNLL